MERKSNANGKRKTQWCLLSLLCHKDNVSSSGVFANVSANVIALNRCSVMEMRWNKNEVRWFSSLLRGGAQFLNKFHPFYVNRSKRFERLRDERVRLL